MLSFAEKMLPIVYWIWDHMASKKIFKVNKITFLSIVMAICLISSAFRKAKIQTLKFNKEDCQGGHFSCKIYTVALSVVNYQLLLQTSKST